MQFEVINIAISNIILCIALLRDLFLRFENYVMATLKHGV